MKKNKKITYAIITTLCVVLFLIWFVKEKESDDVLMISADPTAAALPIMTESSDFSAASLSPETESPVIEPSVTAIPATETPPPMIKVYITGAVRDPGVYEIADGDRIETVLTLAGGATAEADLNAVNLSKKLSDEQQIIIPELGETIDPLPENPAEPTLEDQTDPASPSTDSAGIDLATGKININTADKSTLMTLPGIGEVIADAIIEYREANGAFQSIEDIKNVYRIGDKTFERFKDNIIVGE
jgi:competence protein ComEA